MKQNYNKWIWIAIIVVAGLIAYSALFPPREGPEVVFVNQDTSIINFNGIGIQSFKVNIENKEDIPIDNISIVTKLHNPDGDFIKILDPEISIGTLDSKARSGEKTIEFLVSKTTGDGIKFSGNSTIVVDGLKPSVKEFQIIITSP